MTVVLCELELTIKRVKVSTTPDGRVMDLFFITDTRYTIFCLSNKITLRITCTSLPCLAFYSCVFCASVMGAGNFSLEATFLYRVCSLRKWGTSKIESELLT